MDAHYATFSAFGGPAQFALVLSHSFAVIFRLKLKFEISSFITLVLKKTSDFPTTNISVQKRTRPLTRKIQVGVRGGQEKFWRCRIFWGGAKMLGGSEKSWGGAEIL